MADTLGGGKKMGDVVYLRQGDRDASSVLQVISVAEEVVLQGKLFHLAADLSQRLRELGVYDPQKIYPPRKLLKYYSNEDLIYWLSRATDRPRLLVTQTAFFQALVEEAAVPVRRLILLPQPSSSE